MVSFTTKNIKQGTEVEIIDRNRNKSGSEGRGKGSSLNGAVGGRYPCKDGYTWYIHGIPCKDPSTSFLLLL